MAEKYSSIILIRTESEKEHTVYLTLTKKKGDIGIVDVQGTYDSAYDIVTKITVDKYEDIFDIVKQVNEIPGIIETKTLGFNPNIAKKGLEKSLKE